MRRKIRTSLTQLEKDVIPVAQMWLKCQIHLWKDVAPVPQLNLAQVLLLMEQLMIVRLQAMPSFEMEHMHHVIRILAEEALLRTGDEHGKIILCAFIVNV